MRELVTREAPDLSVEIDSAGIGDWHIGEPPDQRALAAARRRGREMSRLRARPLASEALQRFDFILAMDRANLSDLRRRAPTQYRERVRLFLEFAPDAGVDEVPDPYYGGEAGFEEVLDLAEQAARGLLSHIRERK